MSNALRAACTLVVALFTLSGCSEVAGPGGRAPNSFHVVMYGPETGRFTGNTPASPGAGIPSGALAAELDSARLFVSKAAGADSIYVLARWSRVVPTTTIGINRCQFELSGYITPVYGTRQLYPVRYADGGVPGKDSLGLRAMNLNLCRQISTQPTNIVLPQQLTEGDGQFSLNLRVTGDSAGTADATFIGSVAGIGYVVYSNQTAGEELIRFDLFGNIQNFEKKRDGSVYANGSYIGGGDGPSSNNPGGADPRVPYPAGTIVCPNVPSGYLCVTFAGQTSPLRLMPAGVAPAVYINTGRGVCMTLGNAGISSFRYQPGMGPGGRFTESGRWGALVASTGVITGTADGRQIYLFTGSGDSQLALLTYDTVQQLPIGGGWQRGGMCPYR